MIDEIFVMWLREVKKYSRSKARMIGSLGMPLLFLVSLGLGFGPIFEKAGGGNYIQFLAPGIIGMTILFGSVFNGISLIWDKNFGFLKETLVAPVSRTNLLIGRCVGGSTVATFQAILVLLISYLIGFRMNNLVLLPVLIAFVFIVALVFNLIGTIIASKIEDMQAFQLIMNFIIMPMFFLSGALFPLDNLPGSIKAITQINPLSYGVDGIRYLLIGVSDFGLILDFIILIIMIVFLLMIGNHAFKKIEP